MLKNYLKSYIYLFSIILISTIILTIFNYYFVFSIKLIELLIPIVAIFISSIILGKNTKSRAYLEGMKFTSLYIILSMLISLITKNSFNFKLILCYILFLVTGVVGSMIGINLNKDK